MTKIKFFTLSLKESENPKEVNEWIHNNNIVVINIIVNPLMNSGTVYAMSVCVVYD